MECTKAAQNACELLRTWSGDTVVTYEDFQEVWGRAYALNSAIVSGTLIVLTHDEHEQLVKNQKKRR